MEQRRLNNRIIDLLCEEWEKTAPNTLASETIYERLLQEGEEIPDHAMDVLLGTLKRNGAIRGTAVHDREAARTHGGWYITGVNTGSLCA